MLWLFDILLLVNLFLLFDLLLLLDLLLLFCLFSFSRNLRPFNLIKERIILMISWHWFSTFLRFYMSMLIIRRQSNHNRPIFPNRNLILIPLILIILYILLTFCSFILFFLCRILYLKCLFIILVLNLLGCFWDLKFCITLDLWFWCLFWQSFFLLFLYDVRDGLFLLMDFIGNLLLGWFFIG